MAQIGQGDAALVARIAEGDDAAFAVVYRRYLPLVLRWSLRKTSNREVATDLTSEVFAAALLAARRYDPEQASVGAWLLGIANYKLRSSWSRRRVQDSARRRLQLEPSSLTGPDLDRVDELISIDDQLQALIQTMPAEHRKVLVSRILDERPYEEIEPELRCSGSLVRRRPSRGLQSLCSGIEGV